MFYFWAISSPNILPQGTHRGSVNRNWEELHTVSSPGPAKASLGAASHAHSGTVGQVPSACSVLSFLCLKLTGLFFTFVLFLLGLWECLIGLGTKQLQSWSRYRQKLMRPCADFWALIRQEKEKVIQSRMERGLWLSMRGMEGSGCLNVFVSPSSVHTTQGKTKRAVSAAAVEFSHRVPSSTSADWGLGSPNLCSSRLRRPGLC